MSFFTDPWLYNCADNPADSPEEQLEQRTIIKATQRAADFARDHGVTLVAALGNEHTDLGNPTIDATSRDFPPGTEKVRTVDNTCLDVPAETRGVISVSALGPSGGKADYSNYGTEQTDFSAPGGYFRDSLGTPQYREHREPGAVVVAEERGRGGGQRRPDHGSAADPGRRRQLHRRHRGHLHLLALAARDVDGLAARAGVAALVVSAHGKRTRPTAA